MIRGKKFKLSHSVSGLAALVVFEWLVTRLLPSGLSSWVVLLAALAGAVVTIYVATEVIEEVKNARHMLTLLSIVVAEFVIFFAFEYSFLLYISAGAIPLMPHDIWSALLESLMVFVFNPIYLPVNALGRMLLLINTASALGLVLFILQNIWQFRRN